MSHGKINRLRKRSRFFRLAVVLVPLSLCALTGTVTSGCTACPPGNVEPKDYSKGHTSQDKKVYETNAPNEAWLPFPSGTIYNLRHGLGVTPVSVLTYVSFDQNPLDGVTKDASHPDHASESAGNQAVLERWNDEFVRIRNDSCTDLYLRVVVMAPSSEGLGGAAAL